MAAIKPSEMQDFPEIDVLGLGAVAVDELLYVDGYPPAESKTRVARRERRCGGQTGTALVAAARFGARTAYAGLLGRDPLSGEVVENFRREGVEFRWAIRSPEARPARSTIIVDRLGKTRTVFASVEGSLGADVGGPEEALLCAARVLLIDHHGIEGNLRAARIARRFGRAVVADFERSEEPFFDALLEQVDHLILSERFATQLSGEPDAEKAVRCLASPGRQLVAVTCGAEGCFYSVGPHFDRVDHQAAFEIDVVDTTGCGDVFHGIYAATLAEALPPRERIRIASAAAAMRAAQHGDRAGIPNRQAVEQFLSCFPQTP